MGNIETGSIPPQQELGPKATIYATLVNAEGQLADVEAIIQKTGASDVDKELITKALESVVALRNRYLNK